MRLASVFAISILVGCVPTMNKQLSAIREEPGSYGIEHRMGHVKREEVTSGVELAEPAYSYRSVDPVMLLGGSAERICFRFDFKESTVFLLKADVEKRWAELETNARLSVRTHASLADFDDGKPWPAPNVSKAEVENRSITKIQGETYVTAGGRIEKRSNEWHVRYDLCVPAPEVTPASKYLTLMSLPENDKEKRIVIWELTD